MFARLGKTNKVIYVSKIEIKDMNKLMAAGYTVVLVESDKDRWNDVVVDRRQYKLILENEKE